MARRQYKIAGYNIAGRDVLVQAIPIDRPHERVDVPLARVLKGMFDRPARD